MLQAQQRAAAAAPREVISYIKPNLTISLVDEQSVLTPTQILPQVWLQTEETWCLAPSNLARCPTILEDALPRFLRVSGIRHRAMGRTAMCSWQLTAAILWPAATAVDPPGQRDADVPAHSVFQRLLDAARLHGARQRDGVTAAAAAEPQQRRPLEVDDVPADGAVLQHAGAHLHRRLACRQARPAAAAANRCLRVC